MIGASKYKAFHPKRESHLRLNGNPKSPQALAHTADVQDRDGAPLLLAQMTNRFPWLRHLFADGGYAGDKLKQALAKIGKWTVQIVKRSDIAKGFELLPRRPTIRTSTCRAGRRHRPRRRAVAKRPSAPSTVCGTPSAASSPSTCHRSAPHLAAMQTDRKPL